MAVEMMFSGFVEKDARCVELLASFYEWLKAPEGRGLAPEKASPLANDADRYLRDFLVDILERDAGGSTPATVTGYLGNWYIVNTLIPTHEEIDRIAGALAFLHEFAALKGVVGSGAADGVTSLLADPTHFHERLEEFWDLTPEAIPTWKSLDDPHQT